MADNMCELKKIDVALFAEKLEFLIRFHWSLSVAISQSR